MNGFQKFLTAMFIAGTANAMPIRQFEKMGEAGGPYLADLVQAAEQSLKDAGRFDDAAKVSQIFTTNAPNSNNSIGMLQFYATLQVAIEAAKNNPKIPPIEVSKVLSVCLDKNDGIKLPPEFVTIAKTLDTKYPPQSK